MTNDSVDYNEDVEPRTARTPRTSTIAVISAIVLLYPLAIILALAVGATWQMFSGTGTFPWNVLTPLAVVITVAVGIMVRRFGLNKKMSRVGALALGELAATVIGGPLVLLCFVGSTN